MEKNYSNIGDEGGDVKFGFDPQFSLTLRKNFPSFPWINKPFLPRILREGPMKTVVAVLQIAVYPYDGSPAFTAARKLILAR